MDITMKVFDNNYTRLGLAAAFAATLIGLGAAEAGAHVDRDAKQTTANSQAESASQPLYLSGLTLKPVSHKLLTVPSARHSLFEAFNVTADNDSALLKVAANVAVEAPRMSAVNAVDAEAPIQAPLKV